MKINKRKLNCEVLLFYHYNSVRKFIINENIVIRFIQLQGNHRWIIIFSVVGVLRIVLTGRFESKFMFRLAHLNFINTIKRFVIDIFNYFY